MACLDMYSSNQSSSSSDHNKPPPPLPLPPISPRISFSNDFAEAKHLHRHHKLSPASSSSSSFATPASSDFEFCVPTGNSSTMIGADELFFKGRLLPLKQGTTTLREELMVEDGDQGTRRQLSHRPPLKGWKELLGLRNGSKKSAAKNKGSSNNNHNNNNHQHDQELSG